MILMKTQSSTLTLTLDSDLGFVKNESLQMLKMKVFDIKIFKIDIFKIKGFANSKSSKIGHETGM